MTRPTPPQVLARTPAGRTLLFTLNPGDTVPDHTHPGHTVILAVLAGAVTVTTERENSLTAGEVMTHDGARRIALTALQDSRVLVTLLQDH